jgi:hypothetical protein
MTGTRAANVGRNALAGGMASIGETFIEQQTRPEGYPMLSLGEYATIGGLGSGMGGAMGAFQKARPKIGPIEEPGAILRNQITGEREMLNPSTGLMEPTAIKVGSPRQQQKAFIKEADKIKELGRMKNVDVESINPNLRQPYFRPETPKDTPYNEYLLAAESKINPNVQADAPRAKSSLEVAVDKQAAPAFEAYKKATQNVGKQIGAIKEEWIPQIPEISKDDLIGLVNETLVSNNLAFKRHFTDEGTAIMSLVDPRNGKKRPIGGHYKDLLDALNSVGEQVDGSDLSFFHDKVRDYIPADPVSSQNVVTAATRPLINVSKMAKEAIDFGIESVAGGEVAKKFKDLKAQYRPMRNNVIEIGRQLGQTIEASPSGYGEVFKATPEKGFKKGEGAVSRILQSKQSQGAKFLWDDVRAVTGYDVEKAAAYALQAGEAVDDYTTKSLLDEMGKVNKAIKAMPKDLSNRTMFGTTAEVLKWTGDKVKKWHDEYRNPSQGRGVRAVAEMEDARKKAKLAQARSEQGYQVPNMNLGMFSGRGIIDQPIAEEAIFPYMLGEETK